MNSADYIKELEESLIEKITERDRARKKIHELEQEKDELKKKLHF